MLPLTPCRGVEDVLGSTVPGVDCRGERIWEDGFASLKHDGHEGAWGLGVNPTNRRSQHQVGVSHTQSVCLCAFERGVRVSVAAATGAACSSRGVVHAGRRPANPCSHPPTCAHAHTLHLSHGSHAT